MAKTTSRPLAIRRLFLVVVILKLASSAASWWLDSPWLAGFAVPLSLMAMYIFIGLRRGDRGVSDEKFADSCYYLGFIFTISSILVALLDLPRIDAHLADIAVRFGAAMVSTVFGLIVRVYLVNFAMEFPDAVRDAELAWLESARSFRVHLDTTVDKLRDFQTTVDDAANSAVLRVDAALQDAATAQQRRYAAELEVLAATHRKIAEESVSHLKAATQSLSNAMYDYAASLAAGAGKFAKSADQVAQRMDDRVRHAGLPDDYLASRLAKLSETLAEARLSPDERGAQAAAMARLAESIESLEQTVGSALANQHTPTGQHDGDVRRS